MRFTQRILCHWGLVFVCVTGCGRTPLAPIDPAQTEDHGEAPPGSTFIIAEQTYVSLADESAMVTNLDVAATDDGWAVAWLEFAAQAYQRSVGFALIDASGAVTQRSVNLYHLPNGVSVGDFQVAATETGFLVFWRYSLHDNYLHWVVLDEHGRLSSKRVDTTYGSDDIHGFEIFARDGELWLSYRDIVDTYYSPHIRQLNSFGQRTGVTHQVEQRPRHMSQTRAVWTGTHFLTTWQEYITPRNRVFTGRVEADGTFVASQEMFPGGSAKTAPKLTRFAGDRTMAIWREGETLSAIELDANGVPLTSEATPVGVGNRIESLTWTAVGADNFSLVVREADDETPRTQLDAWQLFGAGAGEPRVTRITDPRFHSREPRVASDGDRIGVAFLCNVAGARRLLFGEVSLD